MAFVTIATEGPTDAEVARRICQQTGHTAGRVFIRRGKGDLDRRLLGYNQAARLAPWLILRDLDNDEDCAPRLLARLIPTRDKNLMVRIAVRKVESWILADEFGIARFLSVSSSLVPSVPDALRDPKEAMVNLARRSRRREIVKQMVAEPGLSTSTGPGYSAVLIDFIRTRWNITDASVNSMSLRRCIDALRRLHENET
ncbi:MAG TPA: hypothetical protein VNA69_13680 [Thermoanaerobaculia bacterium]|nr:hypothetical protein [Thermoanaerobaculia bacterium]